MITLVVDTHAILWYFKGSPELTAYARQMIDTAITSRNQIAIASITLVEIVYLTEKRRINPAALDHLLATLDDPSKGLTLVPLDRAVSLALRLISRDLVPDMPDRIITATALCMNLPVVSADRKIQASGIPFIW